MTNNTDLSPNNDPAIKIKQLYTDHIDNAISTHLNNYASLAHKANLTPNNITTLSLIFGLFACYFLTTKQSILWATTYLISYLLDCLDGYYARKYNMVSQFGDYYDHIKDISIFLIILLILTTKYNLLKHKWIITILTIATINLSIHTGCIEQLYNKNESQSLNITKKMCPFNNTQTIHKIMSFTKLCGHGTYAILLIIIGIFLINTNKSIN